MNNISVSFIKNVLFAFRYEVKRVRNLYAVLRTLGYITEEQYRHRMFLYNEICKGIEVHIFLLEILTYNPKDLK